MRPLLPALVLLSGCLAAQAQEKPMPAAFEPSPGHWQKLDAAQRLADLKRRRLTGVEAELQAAGFHLGNPAYLRVIKESHELEVWLEKVRGGPFELFKTWPIAFFSGTLGPKTKEGDYQAPEGFYDVVTKRLNPLSKYHLSFNIGYPNAFDLAHQRTGGLIMVHGKDVSIGCFAMTDPVIEEIYLIVEAALDGGQKSVPVHCYPFRMTAERLAQAKADGSPFVDFWTELEPGWRVFEQTHLPVRWSVSQGRHVINP